jgi:hypothetical protein
VQFDLPDQAQLLIVIGDSPTLAPIRGLHSAPVLESTPSQHRRPKLKMLGVAALMAVAFLTGQYQGLRHTQREVAANIAAVTPTQPTGHGLNYAELAQPSPPPPPADQIPSAFTRQLHQQPVITPPPGMPQTKDRQGTRAFGLED